MKKTEALKLLEGSYRQKINGILSVTVDGESYTIVNGVKTLVDLRIADLIQQSTGNATVNFRTGEGFKHLTPTEYKKVEDAFLALAGGFWDEYEIRYEAMDILDENSETFETDAKTIINKEW